MDRGVDDLIRASRDRRAQRTGKANSADSDYKPVEKEPIPGQPGRSGLLGGVSKLFTSGTPIRGEDGHAGRMPEMEEEELDVSKEVTKEEPDQTEQLKGADSLKAITNRRSFMYGVKSKLGKTSGLNASQRSAVAKELASGKRSRLTDKKIRKTLQKLEKDGVIQNKAQYKAAKRRLKG